MQATMTRLRCNAMPPVRSSLTLGVPAATPRKEVTDTRGAAEMAYYASYYDPPAMLCDATGSFLVNTWSDSSNAQKGGRGGVAHMRQHPQVHPYLRAAG
jgi:hypothetical protein